MCETHIHGDTGIAGIGWCRGPTACPLIGPLDSYDQDEVGAHLGGSSTPSDGLKLNPGSKLRRDLQEW